MVEAPDRRAGVRGGIRLPPSAAGETPTASRAQHFPHLLLQGALRVVLAGRLKRDAE
jgi:hypothetical protein